MRKHNIYSAVALLSCWLWGHSCEFLYGGPILKTIGKIRVDDKIEIEFATSPGGATVGDNFKINKIKNSDTYVIAWIYTHGRDCYLHSFDLSRDSLTVVLADVEDLTYSDTIRTNISLDGYRILTRHRIDIE